MYLGLLDVEQWQQHPWSESRSDLLPVMSQTTTVYTLQNNSNEQTNKINKMGGIMKITGEK